MDKKILIVSILCGFFVVSGLSASTVKNHDRSEREGRGKENYDLVNFPKGSDPREIGTKLTERYIRTIDTQNPRVNYPYVCTWIGAFRLTQTTGNEELYNRLLERYNNLFFSSGSHNLIPPPNHVDNNVFGAAPLEVYKNKRDEKYLKMGLMYADTQWTLPPDPRMSEKKWHDQGFTWQTRIWIDDMYMITAVQSQAYLVTGDRKYIDRTAKEMVMYLNRIQRPDGLFYHTPDVPYLWGRGNGWMAVGMADLLKVLPKDNPDRKGIEKAYELMMETLLKYQADDGMWRQLLDDPSSWKESSGTAMFTYAMIVGVKEGWLDEKIYGAAARKAWLTLLTYLNDDDNVRNVCEGTNAYNDYQYYINRRQNTGDLHGQAPLLWCADALLQK